MKLALALGLTGGGQGGDSAAAAAQGVLQTLRADSSDATIVVVTDSTGDGATDWVRVWAGELAALFPAFTVDYALWSDGGAAYPAPTTVQAGSGANTLTIWNCAVSGSGLFYARGTRVAPAVTDKTPNLLIISHGHNVGASVTEDQFASAYLGLVEAFREVLPDAAVLCIAENPQTVSDPMGNRRNWLRSLCNVTGYGFLDIYQAFLNYPDWATALMADSVHPNATGGEYWAGIVTNLFRGGGGPRRLITPCFIETGTNLLANADFSAFAGAIPDSWTTSGTPTLAKDLVNKETGDWAVSVVTTGTQGRLVQAVSGVAGYVGKYLTLAARVYRPAASAAVTTANRVGIATSAGSSTSPTKADNYSGWSWEVLTYLIPAGATTLNVSLYADTVSSTGVEAVYDRVYLGVGRIPADAS